ncbi:MAG TPA: hypothetical protein DD381_06440 [Lentisphaeria bacterium]|nr:MAG: hypothetical protein A2X47_13340 [Lentisphaerae bacterium GWF2_38_69]HBM15964.1 hypothetical protein [Lentisphaeria bacterium]
MKIKTKLNIINNPFNYFVPFINIAFLLFIFMTLSSSFVQLSAISIELPHAIGQPINAEKIVITIDKNQNFYFNDQVMDFKSIAKQLADISSRYEIDSIIIRADKNTPQGAVTEILSLANNLNLNVYLAVEAIKSTTFQVPLDKTN